jgi:polygalacturonase
VTFEGITFMDSQFWNLHIYRCYGVTVKRARFVFPDDYPQALGTDGIDLDSSRNVTIEGAISRSTTTASPPRLEGSARLAGHK